MSRRGTASSLAAGGGLVLLVSLFLDWYSPGISAFTAFEVLDLVLAALALAALALAALAPGAAAVASSVGGAFDLSALARALPTVAGLALLIVLSQVLNHPPAAVGAEARAGQWIALLSTAVLAGAAALGARAASPGHGAEVAGGTRAPGRSRGTARSARRPTADASAGTGGDGGRVTRGRSAPAPVRAATAPAEARAAEPEVMGELYPDVERSGPIGGDDPEIARAEPPAGDGPPPSRT